MKTSDELKEIKTEVETVNRKLNELTDEELEQVTSGIKPSSTRCWFGGAIDVEDYSGQIKIKIIRESINRVSTGLEDYEKKDRRVK